MPGRAAGPQGSGRPQGAGAAELTKRRPGALPAPDAPGRCDLPTAPENHGFGGIGKVVLIIGATSGIGAATAQAMVAEGAKVFFSGRRVQLGRWYRSEAARELLSARPTKRKGKETSLLATPKV